MGLKDQQMGKIFISSGTKDRLQPFFQAVGNAERLGVYQHYEVYGGNYSGKRIAFGNGGQYAPDCAIMGEIYYTAGVECIIRVGSCGCLQNDIEIGDIIIVTGAVRDEGTTVNYIPDNFPAVADFNLIQTIIKAAETLHIPYHLGISWTTDGLLTESRQRVSQFKQLNIKSVDMISSSILTIAHHYRKSAGILLAVSDNLSTGELGFFDPKFKKAEYNISRIVLKTIELLPYD
jgi:uridine phosphorylase